MCEHRKFMLWWLQFTFSIFYTVSGKKYPNTAVKKSAINTGITWAAHLLSVDDWTMVVVVKGSDDRQPITVVLAWVGATLKFVPR